MKRGIWVLNIEGVEELNDIDREHISKLILEGYTSGEVIQNQEDDGEN